MLPLCSTSRATAVRPVRPSRSTISSIMRRLAWCGTKAPSSSGVTPASSRARAASGHTSSIAHRKTRRPSILIQATPCPDHGRSRPSLRSCAAPARTRRRPAVRPVRCPGSRRGRRPRRPRRRRTGRRSYGRPATMSVMLGADHQHMPCAARGHGVGRHGQGVAEAGAGRGQVDARGPVGADLVGHAHGPRRCLGEVGHARQQHQVDVGGGRRRGRASSRPPPAP